MKLFWKAYAWVFAVGLVFVVATNYLAKTLSEDAFRTVPYWLTGLIMIGPWFIRKLRRAKPEPTRHGVQAYAQQQGYKYYTSQQALSMNLVFGTVSKVGKTSDPRPLNVVLGDGWTYSDFAYDVNELADDGTVRSKIRTEYYGIMTAKLSRQLPQVFFDSLKARGQQFDFRFDKAQEYSFEGDFNQRFAAYIPTGYTIDTLSFISPEVMLVLEAADDYDIEIIGDHVILLGPLGQPESEIPDMAAKLRTIVKELEDNIGVYHDSHVPGVQGYKTVASSGSRLMRPDISRLGLAVFLGMVAAVFSLQILRYALFEIFKP